ncbi:winged helix-turn-helix domain-containing protein [Natrinema zhouii]|uniref:Helix-turn-helix transcriptional regulator n=1 Tax=Natrinema zhouii TaxID=1710539 RepID=A0A7D6GPK8_9EURY|nr:winged helix-turn-helix domain-containing protein [Natrinema zhouii]QLK25901.1 winged helix-turn-helix domain-containing protein [Natrinema zhouii]
MEPDDRTEAAVREAFSLLDHEIRLEILLALLEDWHAVYTDPKSYAELMDAVGMRDSGKFNYHLDKLRGVYVRQVEDGYVPTASVTALYRAVLAHRPTDRLEYGPTAIDSACPRCDATAILRYERGFVSVECSACDDWPGFTYPFPKNGFAGRSVRAVARATARRARYHIGLARDGQCPFCAGTTTVDVPLDDVADDNLVEIACDTCTFLVGVEPLSPLLFEERVASALGDVGVDLERYDWELPTPTTRVESQDPVRLALEVEGEAGTATIVVDEALGVRSVAIDR